MDYPVCSIPSCKVQALFKSEGDDCATHCIIHRKTGMYDVRNPPHKIYTTNEQPREKYQELLREINELKNSMGEMKKKLDQQMDLIRILRAYKIDALRPDYQNMDGKTKHMCYDDFRIKSHLINYESQLLGRNLQIPSFNQEDDLNEIHDKFFKSLDFYFDQMNMKMD